MQLTESEIVLDENTNMVISKAFVCAVRYYYDTEDGLTKKHIKFADGKEFTENYEKAENDSQVVKFTAGGKTVASHSKNDSFGRKVFDELQLSTGFISRQFSYHAGEVTKEHVDNNMLKSSPTTQLVSQIVLSGGRTISYEYDKEERITRVNDSVDGITEYTYDALGQLVTETKDNQTVVNTMTYDNYGNILTKNGVVYDYDTVWKDKLIKVGDKTITYDEQGNPTQYLGHNLTWEKGRQLKLFEKVENGSTKKVINYTYNANGIRTSKTVDNIRHDYVLDGAKILREGWNFDETINTYRDILVPLYDNEDSVCGIEYNGTAYYFLKNLQGDIIAITDSSGEEVARYSYDAWGVCTVTKDISNCDIANINPFRYRGYFYDLESGLYYLQSRYYDPQVGRFVNGDDIAIIIYAKLPLTFSLYTYCYNNPVNNIDVSGHLAFSMAVIISAAVVGAVFSAISQIAFNYFSGKRGKNLFKGVLGSAVGGAVNAALLLVLWYVPGSNIIAGLIAGFIQALIDGLFEVLVYKTLTWKKFLKKCKKDGLWNSAANIAGNLLGGKLVYIDKNWYKPKYVASFLKGNFGRKIIAQTGIGAILNLIVNKIRKLFKV